ncbi:urease accessory protein UreE [Massilia sp. Mn16-1_5]|uniref:urease accessory protein UreE n=1 Tax=Massilia sp. Mn16-1_5 TaxID=2079199 RepID=UPI00109E4AAD|nr:urease accessory protein UreE [Massilia sp. Mn16-1_5]THC39623.1 urease accessory protein UreE [Massilia sp. Mn16-1_5]
MLTLHTRIERADHIDDEAVLAYDQRERCRLRVKLASGLEAALFLPRGSVLRDGDLLTGPEGAVVRVRAAMEATYRISAPDSQAVVRCAFHLGNRHGQVQIGPDHLRIRADPVLREMLAGLGATVLEELAPFHPEPGAYGGGHGHSHEHEPRHLLAPVPLRQKIHRPGDAEHA